HVGMYVDQTATDSTNPASYQWTLVKGADGSQGTPGKAGADGKTPYFHTAYSWSADGTDRFMTVYPGENLALRTSNPFTMTGSGSNYMYRLSRTIAKGTTVTMTFDIESTNATGQFTIQFVGGSYQGSPGYQMVSGTQHKSYTF